MKKIIEEYWPFAAVIALLAAMLLFGGCRGTKDVTTIHDTVYRNNTEYKTIYNHDSIYVHDSMWMEIKGDTIWIDRWHTQYIELTRIDSVVINDTIYQVKDTPVEVEVARTPLWAWIMLLICVAVPGVWIYKKLF